MTDKPKDGGPAYPCNIVKDNPAYSNGMSLRDWFAGQALMGAISCGGYEGAKMSRIAEQVYSQADAMIEERKK